MKRLLPRGLNRRDVERLLWEIKDVSPQSSRIDRFSHHFLGHSYQTNPLVGSADTAEVFVASLDRFDCVTYVETVLALARATDADDFAEWLRKIRYEEGQVLWERRNHYMTGWIRSNDRERVVRPIAITSLRTVSRERTLNMVPGLAARRIHIRCVPKSAWPLLEPHVRTGDLIFFVSMRKHLDVFHTGIIARDSVRFWLRHASRSQGGVVAQDIRDFLKVNSMTGIILVRPREVERGAGSRGRVKWLPARRSRESGSGKIQTAGGKTRSDGAKRRYVV